MKIYLVKTYFPYECSIFHGVYSSEELAWQRIHQLMEDPQHFYAQIQKPIKKVINGYENTGEESITFVEMTLDEDFKE